MIEGFHIAVSGITGGEGSDAAHATMEKKSISIGGDMTEIGLERVREVFEKKLI